jgi:VWFA-related protein
MQGCVQGLRMRMRHGLVIPLLLCLFSSAPARAAENGEAVFRADANEVRITFAVSDRSGHVVHSLKSSDVAVVDNEWIIRHFRSFRPATETALDLVLLLDASDSVESELGDEIKKARRFLKDAAKANRDRVSILIFGGMNPRLLCLRNCLDEVSPKKLKHLEPSGLTPLYDALMVAARILRKQRDPEVRPAMVLFSDGRDTISVHSLRTTLRTAQALAAPIYTVNVCSDECASADGNAVLAHLAYDTGGLNFDRRQHVSEVLRRVLDDLHSGYVLTYAPPERRSGMHSVRLLPTRDASLRFRSRRAYLQASDDE